MSLCMVEVPIYNVVFSLRKRINISLLFLRRFWGLRPRTSSRCYYGNKSAATFNKGIFVHPLWVPNCMQNLKGGWKFSSHQNLIITTPRTSCIYFLPKIHKPNNPGRPIVSACSCPTELISSYLDKIMAPIVKTLPSYIKDSQHALEIFRDFSFLDQNKLIFTMDITSLYTVIPNDEGLRGKLKGTVRRNHGERTCSSRSVIP